MITSPRKLRSLPRWPRFSEIEAWPADFDLGAERGTRRDDIRPGLRVTGFERRITAAFLIDEPRVVVLRLFYGGRHWGGGGTSAEAD